MSEDTISRQAVIEINRSYHGQMPNEVNHRIWKEINELPSAEPETHEERTETHACDCISRQAAIDALQDRYKLYSWDDGGAQKAEIGAIIREIYDMPSAQPETHEERTETHACDYINRKDAIDAHYEYCNKHPDAGFPVWSLKILKDLPPAQPDLSGYSDRLWKAAYERGKVEAQRKKGKWIEYDNSHCECPFCHEEWSYFDNEVECFNYCPNCGADMREDGEADETRT